MSCPVGALTNIAFNCKFTYNYKVNNYTVVVDFGDGFIQSWIQTIQNTTDVAYVYRVTGTYQINASLTNSPIPMFSNQNITGF